MIVSQPRDASSTSRSRRTYSDAVSPVTLPARDHAGCFPQRTRYSPTQDRPNTVDPRRNSFAGAAFCDADHGVRDIPHLKDSGNASWTFKDPRLSSV
jgi:hypothetical protein